MFPACHKPCANEEIKRTTFTKMNSPGQRLLHAPRRNPASSDEPRCTRSARHAPSDARR